MVHIGRSSTSLTGPKLHQGLRWTFYVVMIASAALSLGACARSSATGGTAAAPSGLAAGPSDQAKTENIELIGKIDAEEGAPGTFTGKEHWPAFAPADIHVSAGATVVLTIKAYDDMVSELPDGSPYGAVMGGTEMVDGKQVTTVGNHEIAHTISIPALGINIPVPMAPEGGVTTVTFTFKAPAAGTYEWKCLTPCGDGDDGMGGAMQSNDWMRGHLIVS